MKAAHRLTHRPNRRHRVLAGTASLAVLSLLVVGPSSPALGEGTPGSSGDVDVVNSETVQAYLSPTGEVDSERVYEQLSLTGTGRVDLANPITTEGLRNLDGFGGFDVVDGEQLVRQSVDGETKLRTVSDYDGDLPLDVAVTYRLDGEEVEPGDLVGEAGELEVEYTVTNVTGVEQEVSFDDGTGGTMTRTVEVPIPMVGSLTTTAPDTFSNVRSEQANLAGDGKGGTKLSFTMTLFPPIGAPETTFGYTADITEGVVPRADITALPVNPLESPTFSSAAESYQGGADTGVELTDGATEIDANLLKLRDGASSLLAGLIKLDEGAGQLSDGLNDDAAPGSEQLADGAGDLADGLGRLDDGAGDLADGTGDLLDGVGRLTDGTGRLADGARTLDAGAGDLADGAGRLEDGAGDLADGTGAALEGSATLRDGLRLISGGLGQLADAKQGLPAASAGITALQTGVDQLLVGLGDARTEGTLLNGIARLRGGLGDAQTDGTLVNGAGKLVGGLQQLGGPQGLQAAKGGVDQVIAALSRSGAAAGIDRIDQTLAGAPGLQICRADKDCAATIAGIRDGLAGPANPESLKAQLSAGLGTAIGGLQQVSGGLTGAITAVNTQLTPGAATLQGGLGQLSGGARDLDLGLQRLQGGVVQVRAGLTDLGAGVQSAVAGVLQLDPGAAAALAGSNDLVSGLGRLDGGANLLQAGAGELLGGTGRLTAGTADLADGAGALDEGAGDLADGAGRLDDGAGRLADGTGDALAGSTLLSEGAAKLAAGLGDAASGSTRLADGLGEAADGAPQLVDGSQRLSDEGTSKLVEAGEDTAQNYGEMVAVLDAGAERAQTEKMVVGAPEDATGMTAYSYVIAGEDGEGGRNLSRGLAGLGILAAGAGVFGIRRRLL